MKEIVERLHEQRRVELAKEILESKGYKVMKDSVESIPDIPNIPGDFLEISGGDDFSKLEELSPYGDTATRRSLINRTITNYKKSLEKLCGCKLAKSYPKDISANSSLSKEYVLSPNPNKRGMKDEYGRKEFFYSEQETWYIVLGFDESPSSKFYLGLYDEEGERLLSLSCRV